jgi:hypothetical protein
MTRAAITQDTLNRAAKVAIATGVRIEIVLPNGAVMRVMPAIQNNSQGGKVDAKEPLDF